MARLHYSSGVYFISWFRAEALRIELHKRVAPDGVFVMTRTPAEQSYFVWVQLLNRVSMSSWETSPC